MPPRIRVNVTKTPATKPPTAPPHCLALAWQADELAELIDEMDVAECEAVLDEERA